MEGFWEFPGGKVDPGEDPRDGLARELLEELRLSVKIGEIEETIFHQYDDRDVLLLFYHCAIRVGEPQPQLGQEIRWATPGEMERMEFLPADEPLIRRLLAQGPVPEESGSLGKES